MKYILVLALSLVALFNHAQDPWKITASDIDPSNYYGVTIANGVVGIISSPEPLKVKDVVLNGVYDHYQRGRVSNILKVFNHVNMQMDVDGKRVERKNITGFQQSLDMKGAELVTTFEVPGKIKVNHRMLSLRHLPYTALSVVEITAIQDVEITPMSVIESPVHLQDVRNYYAEIDRPHVLIPLMTSVGLSPTGQFKIAASNSFIFDEAHGQEPDIIHEDWDYNMHLMKFRKKLKAGQTYRFAVTSSVVSSYHHPDPQNEAERLTIFATLEKTDRLLQFHHAAWKDLWDTGNIFVEGNVGVERDIRFALYHLYSFARAGTAYSLSPMGLSGLGYNGHIFWDTELWMYPPLLMLQPEIAKSLLAYRYERLDAARANAFAHGYEGAMFPWESAADGTEDTPVWALTGPFQHHITGCVAWANWKYYQVTKDKEWLRERGWPVLKAAAEFWASRVERNGPQQYDIKNVIGANEWLENIDNNAFTNGMAITALQYANTAAKELGYPENADWTNVAANIPILKFPDGTTKENTTYSGVVIKQADAVLLSYPLSIVTDAAEIKKDLEYYTPRTSPEGPAMGAAVSSILYNRLGKVNEAADIFSKSYKLNEVPPFGVISETAGGTNPYFATGAGGMLQAVLAGFGGLTITDAGIEQLKSSLPKGWKKLRIVGVGEDNKVIEVRE
ncbi:MAG: glycoside hydrolase family 65 protein [Bacteroidota bacterium]|nr:glycoside hydrolase family 65 protein [Bacteroidota bacterium]